MDHKKGQQPQKDMKDSQLEEFRVSDAGEPMTTNQGVRISEDEHSLKAGERGPTLMEDFHFREKLTHFDHERIPERVVHARGFGVHGYFQVYKPMTKYTKAKFLQDPSIKTAGIRTFLHRGRFAGFGRYGAGCPGLCHQVLHGGRKL